MNADKLKAVEEIVELLAYERFYSEARLLKDFIDIAKANMLRVAHMENKDKKRVGEFW